MSLPASQLVRKSWCSQSEFETIAGYDRALRVGDWVFVAGTTGFDYSEMTISSDLAEQVRQALLNVDTALHKVEASLREVVKLTWFITDESDYRIVADLLRQALCENRPPATTLVCKLVDPRMRFELEVTAWSPRVKAPGRRKKDS